MESSRRRRSSGSSRDEFTEGASSSRSRERSSNGEGSGSSSSSGSRERSSSRSSSREKRRVRSRQASPPGEEDKTFRRRATLVGLLVLGILIIFGFLFSKILSTKSDTINPPDNPPGSAAGTVAGHPAEARSAPGVTLPPEPTPARPLEMTMEDYCDKLNSFGNDMTGQADFIRSTKGCRVNWKCKVYSVDVTSLNKGALLSSALKNDETYHVSATFDNPNQDTMTRLRLLQRGDTVRLTGTLSQQNVYSVDAESLTLIP